MNLYVIWDKVAKASGPVFEAVNDGVALRNFVDFLKKVDVARDDFEMFRVGRIDHERHPYSSDGCLSVETEEVKIAVQ